METKMLHELIELAMAGKKFEARCLAIKNNPTWVNNEDFIQDFLYGNSSITSKWEYKEILEPQIIEFEGNWYKDSAGCILPIYSQETLSKLLDKKWKVVCTEIIEEL